MNRLLSAVSVKIKLNIQSVVRSVRETCLALLSYLAKMKTPCHMNLISTYYWWSVRSYLVMGTIMLDHKIGDMLNHDLIEENL